VTYPIAKLGEVAEFIRGITFKPDDVVPLDTDDAVVCMRTKNVQALLDCDDLLAVPSQFVRRKDQYLEEGDILVSSANSWNLVGKCCWIPRLPWRAAFGGFIAVLRGDSERVDRRYLYWWFASDRIQALLRSFGQKTTNISNLNIERCLGLDLPLPPLPEQRRIAAILDKADALRTRRREALAQLDRLAQSIFVEMFGDPVSNPKGWLSRKLGDLTVKMGSGSTPTGGDAAYKESGISLIRSMNVHNGCFVHKNLAFIDDAQGAKLKNVVVEADDVLLNITGASVARVCRAPSDVLPARVNQHVMIIRTSNELSSIFLERLLLNPSMKTLLLKVGGAGATREAITKADAEELSVIVPPKGLQLEFERRLRQTLKLHELHEAELTGISDLFSSLQHCAFRGKL